MSVRPARFRWSHPCDKENPADRIKSRFAGFLSSDQEADRFYAYYTPGKLMPSVVRNGGIDILVTHAPAQGINDLPNVSHRGFGTFRKMLERYHPVLFVHGHVHRNYALRVPQKERYGQTLIINAFEYCIAEIDETGRASS